MEKNSEGRKFDTGKPRVAEMVIDFGDAMLELSKVWAFGADKYDKSNWKFVENGKDRYTNALLRHLIAEGENQYDDESKLLHATHVAWNALARLWFILKCKVAPREYIEDFFDSNMYLYLDKDIHTTKVGDINIIDNKKERLD